MDGDDRGRAVVATFPHAWEAELARSYLADSGIEAWVDPAGLDDPYRVTDGGIGMVVRLFADADRVAEARVILAEIEPESEPAAAGQPARRRPRWVVLVAALLLGGFAVIAVPASLRLPVALIGLAGYYVAWRRRRPPD